MALLRIQMRNKRILVSGGAGVIGLEMIPRLVALGAKVFVGDLKPRPETFTENVIYRQGDLNTMTREEFDSFCPDIFIHLAATFERSEESYDFWQENFLHNLSLSHHLMTLAKESKSLRRVVFASSYLIYDPKLYQFETHQGKPISLKESDPILPRNLTGMAKLAHEIEMRFIDNYCRDRLSTVCARIYRGYGRNSRDVISRWIRSLLKGEPITVYRPEGIFDFIYSADTAEGLIRLDATEGVKGVINLGTGRSRSVQSILDLLYSHFPNMKTELIHSDILFEASQADMTKYQKFVGWMPIYDLPEAIAEIITFERKRIDDVNSGVKKPLKLLVSSAAGKVPLVRAMQAAVKKIDPNGRVIAGDTNPESLTAHVADHFWLMPPTNIDNLEMIIRGLHDQNISLVLPSRDGELMFWAKNADRMKSEGITVLVSKYESLERCLDKLEFWYFGDSKGLPFIPTSDQISSINSNRFVVKERFGAGSKSIGIDLDYEQAIAPASKLEFPIFQPFITGNEFTVDAWVNQDHTVKAVALRYRNKVVNGESQITTTFSNNALEIQIRNLIEFLELNGPVVLQVIHDQNYDIQVIECNARFGGASTLGVFAGVDSFYWSILEAQGANLNDYPFIRSKIEVRQVRIPTDIYVADTYF